jgi:predicted MPP superfamily phosphohydrolase
MKIKKLLKFSLAIFVIGFIVGIGLLAYTYYIEPYRLVVKEVTLGVPRWSPELNGFRIVALSDLHGGSHTVTEDRIRSLTEQINAQNPDIIVMLGDFVSQVHDDVPIKKRELKMPIETIARNLGGLRAKYGVFVVIGNHDWWYDEAHCRQAFEAVGFTVLENQTSSFEINKQTVTVLGIEDFWKREKVDVDRLLAALSSRENIIGITHNPDSFDQTPDSLSILLAGHTHGGQVRFPLVGSPIVPAKKDYTAGHVIKDGRHLFVTTGIGTSGLPFRFRVPPEIVVLTLNSLN